MVQPLPAWRTRVVFAALLVLLGTVAMWAGGAGGAPGSQWAVATREGEPFARCLRDISGRNIVVALVLMSGMVTGGIGTLVGSLALCLQLARTAAGVTAANAAVVTAAVLPHAVVEIPLFVAACGVGASGPWLLGLFAAGRPRAAAETLAREARRGLWILAGVIVAATIECLVTPIVIGLAAGTGR